MTWQHLGDFNLSANEWVVSPPIEGEIYRISSVLFLSEFEQLLGVVAPVFFDDQGLLNIFHSEAQRFIYQNFYDVKCLPSFLGIRPCLGFKRLDKHQERWIIKAESFRATSTEDNIGNTIRFAWRNLSVPDIIQQFPRLQAEKERVAMQFPLDLIEVSSTPVVVLPVRELNDDKKTRQSLYLQNTGNDRVMLRRISPGQSLSDSGQNPVVTYLEPGSSYSETDDTVSGIVAFCEDGDNTALNRSEYMFLPWQEQAVPSVNSISSSPNPSAVGAAVTFSATVPGVVDDFKLVKIGANNEWETQIQVLNGTGTATGAPSLPVGSYPLRLTHTSGEVIAESEFVVVA